MTDATARDVFDYEASMFLSVRKLRCGNIPALREAVSVTGLADAVTWAVVESELLHVRNLAEFFRAGKKFSTDKIIAHLFPDGMPGSVMDAAKKVQAAYREEDKQKLKEGPAHELDKLLAHPTDARTTGHDYGPLFRLMEPPLSHAVDVVFVECARMNVPLPRLTSWRNVLSLCPSPAHEHGTHAGTITGSTGGSRSNDNIRASTHGRTG